MSVSSPMLMFQQFLMLRWLAVPLALAVACLLLAPHVPVTREAHCGLLVTLHMMETGWTLIFTAAALGGLVALIAGWPHLAAAIGVGAAGYAIYLMSQIRSWYSYQAAPEELDLMAKIFGHVLDVGLPLALVGSVLLVIVSIAYPDRSVALQTVARQSITD